MTCPSQCSEQPGYVKIEMSGPLSQRSGWTCDREVIRKGEFDPCGKPATGVAYWEGELYPACNAHRMSSPKLLAAYIADRSWS